MFKDIDYALVEKTRPPLYTCMKYWGKKPHNIWNKYISNYVGKNGIYLDPFAGSAMSAFEAFFSGKKCFALDINPLTSFIIETVCSRFDEKKFIKCVNDIYCHISEDKKYKELYCYRSDVIVHNVKWNQGEIYEVCTISLDGKEKKCHNVTKLDVTASTIDFENDNLLYPKKNFRKAECFSKTFLKAIGNSYDKLYTRRNLYILSVIFGEILKINDDNIRKQLLYGFIQTVHLSTKMCVPRGKSSNRDFSTSWGRSTFICSKKQMEMNPLLLFRNNCIGKQSVQAALNDFNNRAPKRPVIADINMFKYDPKANVDIWYGIVDSKKMLKYIPEKTVNFILTDPPYGGLVQYLDLSSVWLSWLELIDKKYVADTNNEITIGLEKTKTDFTNDLSNVLLNAKKVLKDDGKLVLTFNNKDITVWNSLLKSIFDSGFRIEKVIHQPNKRSSESNVDDPNGMASSDYYIRCVKTDVCQKNKEITTENELVNAVKHIIMSRNEPTPYNVLLNGFLCKISEIDTDLIAIDKKFDSFLNKHINKDFSRISSEDGRAGDYWWIYGKKFNKESSRTLSNRVKKYILKCVEDKCLKSYDDLIQEIYIKFPNGLTPESDFLKEVIRELVVINSGRLERKC